MKENSNLIDVKHTHSVAKDRNYGVRFYVWILVTIASCMVAVVFTRTLVSPIGVIVTLLIFVTLCRSKTRTGPLRVELGIGNLSDLALFLTTFLFASSVSTILITTILSSIGYSLPLPVGVIG
jgi:hypothetical protein